MDKVVEFGVKQKFLVVLIVLGIGAGGWYSFRKIPLDAFPDVSPVLVQIFTVAPGLAPEEVERFITYPTEIAMYGLPNLRLIRSVSNFGLSVVNLYFEDGTDIYFARQVVGERMADVREIVEEFGEVEMGPISTATGLILFYFLENKAGFSPEKLREIQDWFIKPLLMETPGVNEVLGIGGYVKMYHVDLDWNALLMYDISPSDVVERIKENNKNVGAQFIVKNLEEYSIRVVGLAEGVEDLKKIVLKNVNGTPVYLSDVAHIHIGGDWEIRRGIQTMDGGEEIVAGMVIKLWGENSSEVISRVEEKIRRINDALPEGVRIVPYYAQKDLVMATIKTVTSALAQGIVLVALLLWLFVGKLRTSIAVILSMPFSIALAFILMKRFGISANLMSFGGIAIAIGIIVDGSIVVVENIARWIREKGRKTDEIILSATREVIKPIFFAILIIVITFLPLFSLTGYEGKFFKPLAYTVAIVIASSIVYTVLVSPVFAYFFVSGKQKEVKFISKLERLYGRVLRFILGRAKWIAFSLAGGMLLIGLVSFMKLGSEFIPTLDEGTIVVRLTMSPTISIEYGSKKVVAVVEKEILEIPEVRRVVTRIGRGEVGAHSDPPNNAEMYVLLKPKDMWRPHIKSQRDIEEEIRKKIQGIPGVIVNLTQPIKMTIDELTEGIRADLAVKIFGDDFGTLKRIADEVAEILRGTEGSRDVQIAQVSGSPQIVIKLERDELARYGLNVADVQETVQIAVGGVVPAQIFEGNRRFDIFVRLAPEWRKDKTAIENLLINTPAGFKVPLKRVAEVKEVVGMRSITRENGQRFISVQCNVVGRDIGSFVKEVEEKMKEKIDLPAGYYMRWGGQFRFQQEAFQRLSIVIPITLGLIVVLLFMSFASVRDTLLILFNIPLALSGGALALFISGQNLSVPSAIGFIALFGIALENGMVLISFINRLIENGEKNAIIRGSVLRLRPVLMTAFTTALGLIPLVFSKGTGSEVQRPLAVVVVGGILTSTLLTLIVLPVFKKVFSGNAKISLKPRASFSAFLFGVLLSSSVGVFALPQKSYGENAWRYTPNQVISIEQAIHISIKQNPGVLRAENEVKSVEGSIIQAGLYPNPFISLEFEDVGLPLPEATGVVGQIIPLGRKLSKRKMIFRFEKKIAEHVLDLVKLEVYRAVKSSFYTSLMLKEKLKISEKINEILQKFVDIAQDRVSLGEAPRTDLRIAEIELSRNKSNLIALRRDYESSLWNLAVLMGKKKVDFDIKGEMGVGAAQNRTAIFSVMQKEEEGSFEVPQVLVLKSMIDRERARETFERSLRIPDLGVSAGIRRVFGEGWAFVGGISFLIPVFDRRQGELIRIKYTKEALHRELERVKLEVKGKIKTLTLQLDSLRSRILSLQNEIIPLAEKNLQDITEGYRRGKFSIIDVLHAQNTLFSSQIELIELVGAYKQVETELEILMKFKDIKKKWF